MQYAAVGAAGVQVSPLCRGTMSFGPEADEQVSAEMFHRARERDINFFDTTDMYGQGRSEELLGKLVAGCHDDVVIAWKVFYPTGPAINAQGNSRRHSVGAVEESLKRLGTDRIDFYGLQSGLATAGDRFSALSPSPAPATDRTETLKPNWT